MLEEVILRRFPVDAHRLKIRKETCLYLFRVFSPLLVMSFVLFRFFYENMIRLCVIMYEILSAICIYCVRNRFKILNWISFMQNIYANTTTMEYRTTIYMLSQFLLVLFMASENYARRRIGRSFVGIIKARHVTWCAFKIERTIKCICLFLNKISLSNIFYSKILNYRFNIIYPKLASSQQSFHE